MTDTDDIYTMLIWVFAILFIVFIIDILGLRPVRDSQRTEKLLRELKEPAKHSFPLGKGAGIVTIMDDTTFISGALTIIGLRNLQCHLPIIIYYSDLEDSQKKFLKGLSNVKLHTFEGTKIEAILHAPFNQVMYVEPDLIFLRNPERLFLHDASLFWLDIDVKGVWDRKVCEWVNKIIPYKRPGNRILNREAGTHQSGDLFIIKKSPALLQNLIVLNKNIDVISGYINEKELFWIAAELARDRYSFIDKYPGVIGEYKINRICGHVLHFDGFQPLVFNGSLDSTHFTHFCENGMWTGMYKCMSEGDFYPLTPDVLETINNYAMVLHDLQQL